MITMIQIRFIMIKQSFPRCNIFNKDADEKSLSVNGKQIPVHLSISIKLSTGFMAALFIES